ncbi:MAG: carboxylesterase/lipase family protein [Gammaproteobacteria bacterium]|nr:carboxylesterase/lipase family protein [Gammaproteobacteria bacterium]
MSVVLPLIVCAFLISGCTRHSEVVVETPGGTIRGIETDGVHRFLGVRYAEPPTGKLRWKPPVPILKWEGVLDADEFGPWCPQFDFERRQEGEVHSGEGWTIFRNVPSNHASQEDCLSVNVFTAAADGTKKPVMVFLHGNALGSSYPMYDGTDMAKGGVVYVSINYRLHSLGIFAHPSLTEDAKPDEPLGRYAEMDRLEALRWVQRNIAAFGGDPTQVTLAGNSEGGAAILQLLSNPAAQGLFHRAIVQSGNGWWAPLSHQQHEELGCYLASLSGLNGCDSTAEELRSLEWSEIPATGPYTIDERQRTIGATQAIESGRVLDVPLLIGWNDFDGSSLRYSPQEVIDHTHPEVLAAYDTNKPMQDLAYEIYTDLHSGAPARWVANKLQDGEPVYLYLYTYVISWDRDSVRGAEHGYEVPHALSTLEEMLDDTFPFLSKVLLDDEDRQMTYVMHHCWLSFVKTGKPSCPGAPDWPAYNRDSDKLMKLNLEPKIVSGFRARQLDAQEMHRSHYFEQVKKSIRRLLAEGV